MVLAVGARNEGIHPFIHPSLAQRRFHLFQTTFHTVGYFYTASTSVDPFSFLYFMPTLFPARHISSTSTYLLCFLPFKYTHSKAKANSTSATFTQRFSPTFLRPILLKSTFCFLTLLKDLRFDCTFKSSRESFLSNFFYLWFRVMHFLHKVTSSRASLQIT
jgi:hypothetical protein